MIPEKRHHLFLSLLAGVVYGLLGYLFLGRAGGARLATVGALVGLPFVIGWISVGLVPDGTFKFSPAYRWIGPWIAGLMFLGLLAAMGIESLLCMLVLSLPLFLGIGLVLLVLYVRRRRAARRASTAAKILVLLAPFALAEIEFRWCTTKQSVTVGRSVDIGAADLDVWDQIVQVSPISPDEYGPGPWIRLGVPQPRFATVDGHVQGGLRRGTFDGDLAFVERMTEFEPGRQLKLDVTVDPATLRAGSTESHAFLSGVFSLHTVTYQIAALSEGSVRLSLSCSYVLKSTVNAYGELWARAVVSDFEARLLSVIKRRVERLQKPLPQSRSSRWFGPAPASLFGKPKS